MIPPLYDARVHGIYRSAAGRAAILGAYEQRLAALPAAVTSRMLDTRFGAAHVLLVGPSEAPPLVLVHGSNGDAGQLLAALAPTFASSFRCVFVDVPGEPGRSSEVRLDKGGPDLGLWLADVLDALALPRAAMLGISGGAYVVLRGAAVIPERIARAVLLTPEGFSRADEATLDARVRGPIAALQREPSADNARRAVQSLCSRDTPLPEAAIAEMSRVLAEVIEPMRLGPLLTAEELRRFTAPVLILAAGEDVLFPGYAAVERARAVLPDLRDAVVVPDANHVDLRFFFGPLIEQARAFLLGG